MVDRTGGSLAGRRIALYFAELGHGGVQRAWITLAREFARLGAVVDLVVETPKEPCEPIPPGVRVVLLETDRTPGASERLALRAAPLVLLPRWHRRRWILGRDFRQGPALVRYLRGAQPHALLAGDSTWIMRAAWALAAARTPTRFIAAQRSAYSQTLTRADLTRSAKQQRRQALRRRIAPKLLRQACLRADAVVVVSRGVASDLSATTGFPKERITVIYGPAIGEDAAARLAQPLAHPWLQAGEPPVILGVGRFAYSKNFEVLLRAFARVRAQRAVRLLILGDGDERPRLEALARSLGVAADVGMPGFVANPYPWYARAGVFALSSRFEGLSRSIIEALYCGCPVVSTDCPHGPAELLDGRRYGRLVPVGDDAALAAALAATLDGPPDRALLRVRGAEFTVAAALARYLELPGLAPEPVGAAAAPAGAIP